MDEICHKAFYRMLESSFRYVTRLILDETRNLRRNWMRRRGGLYVSSIVYLPLYVTLACVSASSAEVSSAITRTYSSGVVGVVLGGVVVTYDP